MAAEKVLMFAVAVPFPLSLSPDSDSISPASFLTIFPPPFFRHLPTQHPDHDLAKRSFSRSVFFSRKG